MDSLEFVNDIKNHINEFGIKQIAVFITEDKPIIALPLPTRRCDINEWAINRAAQLLE